MIIGKSKDLPGLKISVSSPLDQYRRSLGTPILYATTQATTWIKSSNKISLKESCGLPMGFIFCCVTAPIIAHSIATILGNSFLMPSRMVFWNFPNMFFKKAMKLFHNRYLDAKFGFGRCQLSQQEN